MVNLLPCILITRCLTVGMISTTLPPTWTQSHETAAFGSGSTCTVKEASFEM